MIHSIICWDCSFRNFFHTIDGLLNQAYNRDQFEIIYIEQRSHDFADAFNHDLKLKSLWDRYEEVKDKINIKVIYLNDPPDIPYHLGKTVNHGIKLAKGEIVSVMDGDMLLPPNFLTQLKNYHRDQGVAVVNLFRHMADGPVGVDKENWTEAVIDLDRCLELCPTRNNPIPRTNGNKGPLISARKEAWDKVGGYDEHFLWSTGLTRLGQDVTARLEIVTGVESTVLPDCFAVHPWHPMGFRRETLASQRMLSLHNKLINWSRANNEPSWEVRIPYTKQIYTKNEKVFDKMIYPSLQQNNKSDDDLGTQISMIFGRILQKLDRLRGGF